MSTARARDVWSSKCGKKAVVRAPVHAVGTWIEISEERGRR